MAIDGSSFRAVNTRDKNFTRAKMKRRMEQIEEPVERYLHQLDSADRQEPSLARATKTPRLKDKVAKLKEEMGRLGKPEARMLAEPGQHVSLTDPDARSMATSRRGSGMVGYNVQAAADISDDILRPLLGPSGFLSHLRALMATMIQKFSLIQYPVAVS